MRSRGVRAAVIVCAGVLLACAALAADGVVPRYDPPAYCQRVASFGGGYSESIYGACIESEQEAYDDLKQMWSSIPDRIAAYCNRVASFGGSGTYSIMQSCVESEQEEAAKNATTEFKF